MRNLLTGKNETRHDFPASKPNPIVEDEWTPAAYLAAMRRLLFNANSSDDKAPLLIDAAKALAIAALAADNIAFTPSHVPSNGDTIASAGQNEVSEQFASRVRINLDGCQPS